MRCKYCDKPLEHYEYTVDSSGVHETGVHKNGACMDTRYDYETMEEMADDFYPNEEELVGLYPEDNRGDSIH